MGVWGKGEKSMRTIWPLNTSIGKLAIYLKLVMDRKTCDLLLPEDTSDHYIWLVWDFKESGIAIFKIYSVISWRQDNRHMSLMLLGPAVKTRLRPQRNSLEKPFQNIKRMHVYNWSLELRCLYPTGVAKSTTGMITLCRVRHKGHSRCILNVTIDSYGVVTFLHPLIVIALPYPKAKRTSTH